jgi:hypothetical protein
MNLARRVTSEAIGTALLLATVVGSDRHVRPAGGHPRLFTLAPGGCAICNRRIYHRSLLVYVINVIREPGRNAGQGRERYFRWHSPPGCARLCRRPSCWRGRRYALSVA